MAININPVDFRGFALGGAGNVQLPNVGALGLQAIQAQMQSRDNAAQIAAQERMNMARINSADYQALQQRAMEQARAAEMARQFNMGQKVEDRRLGLLEQKNVFDTQAALREDERTRLGYDVQMRGQDIQDKIASQNFMQDQMKTQLEELTKKKKSDLDNLGAFAVQAKLAMEQAPDPSSANILRQEIITESVQNGFIDKDLGQQLKRMPLSGFTNYLNYATVITDTAKQLKDLRPEEAKGDVNLTVSPDGTVQYSSQLTKENKAKAQEDLAEANEGLTQVKNFLNPPKSFFGIGAYKQIGTKLQEQASNLTGLPPNKEAKEELEKYTQYNANAKLMIMKTAKAMAGARFSDTDLKMIEEIMPQVGPGHTQPEFEAKTKLVMDYLNNLKSSKEGQLTEGILIGEQKPLSELSDEELMSLYKGGK